MRLDRCCGVRSGFPANKGKELAVAGGRVHDVAGFVQGDALAAGDAELAVGVGLLALALLGIWLIWHITHAQDEQATKYAAEMKPKARP